MRKTIFHLFVLFVALTNISCNDDAKVCDDMQPITEAYQYPVVPGMPEWADFHTGEAMFAACQVPENIVKRLTTEALVETCMTWPLRTHFILSNDFRKSIEFYMNEFSGYIELAKRKDAVKYLIGYYLNAHFDTNEEGLDKCCTLVLQELLLLYPTFFDAMSTEELYRVRDHMVEVCIEKLESGYSVMWFYSSFWLDDAIAEKLGIPPSIVTTRAMGDLLGTTTVYTPKGSEVKGLILEELPNSEIARRNNYVIDNYPDATILAPATYSYNCHSYAWNMTEGGPVYSRGGGEK